MTVVARRWAALLGLITTALALGAAQAQTLSWVGDRPTTQALMSDLADAFERRHDVTIDVARGSSSDAIRKTAAGEADMGGTTRPRIDTIEAERRVTLFPVAWDAFVVIVNKANPIRNINLTELHGVCTGAIDNWQALGGEDAEIHLFSHAEELAGIDYGFKQILFGDPQAELASDEKLASTADVEAAVAKDTQGIAITTISSARNGDNKILRLQGRSARYASIKRGDYLLFQPLYIAMRQDGEHRRSVRRFIRFAQGPRAKRILRENGVVPYREGISLVARQRQRETRLQGLAVEAEGN